MTKTVQYQNELHKFLIWDTAGQERVSHSLIYYVFFLGPSESSNSSVDVPCHFTFLTSPLQAADTFISVYTDQPFSFQLEPHSPLMEKAIMGTEGIFILFSVFK